MVREGNWEPITLQPERRQVWGAESGDQPGEGEICGNSRVDGGEGGGEGRDSNKPTSDEIVNDNISQEGKQDYFILYSNVRSILNKLLEFQAYVYEQQPDVICLCETFVRPDISSALLSLTVMTR